MISTKREALRNEVKLAVGWSSELTRRAGPGWCCQRKRMLPFSREGLPGNRRGRLGGLGRDCLESACTMNIFRFIPPLFSRDPA